MEDRTASDPSPLSLFIPSRDLPWMREEILIAKVLSDQPRILHMFNLTDQGVQDLMMSILHIYAKLKDQTVDEAWQGLGFELDLEYVKAHQAYHRLTTQEHEQHILTVGPIVRTIFQQGRRRAIEEFPLLADPDKAI